MNKDALRAERAGLKTGGPRGPSLIVLLGNSETLFFRYVDKDAEYNSAIPGKNLD